MFDHLKLPQQNPKTKDKRDKTTDKPTILYPQFCHGCEYLSSSQNTLESRYSRLQSVQPIVRPDLE